MNILLGLHFVYKQVCTKGRKRERDRYMYLYIKIALSKKNFAAIATCLEESNFLASIIQRVYSVVVRNGS